MGRLPLPRTSMDVSRSYYSSSAGGGQYRQGYASSSLHLTDGNARSGVALFAEHHPQQQHGRSLSFTHQGLQPPHVLPNSHNPHSQGNFNGGNTQQTGRQPAGNGADDSEFVNIAETLTKLTPRPNPSPPTNSTTAIASSIALVPGLLPPITGESFVGNLPSLNVLGAPEDERSKPVKCFKYSTHPVQQLRPVRIQRLVQPAGRQRPRLLNGHKHSAHINDCKLNHPHSSPLQYVTCGVARVQGCF